MGKVFDDDGVEFYSVHLFYGSPDGTEPDSEAVITSEYGDDLGCGLAGPIDLNDDGYDDLLIGASGDDDQDYNTGVVYLFYGTSSGVSSSREAIYTPDAKEHDRFGWALAALGDLNGDGLPDLLVGAYGAGESGEVLLLNGTGDGLENSQRLTPPSLDSIERFGATLSEGGDINGDGYFDALIGVQTENDNGEAYPIYGAVGEVTVESSDRIVASDNSLSGLFSASIAEAGDIDGDGFDDVIVGAYRTKHKGSSYLYYGSASGLDLSSEVLLQPDTSDGQQYFGYAVSGIGDANGDGYDDLLIGSPGVQPNGAAYFYPGGAGGLDVTARAEITPSQVEDGVDFGATITGAGDVDGDGGPDVLVSAGGSVYILNGEPFVDVDGDGVPVVTDCDDADPDIGGPADWFMDTDGDDFGDPNTLSTVCEQPSDTISDGTDCDDQDETVHPGAEETCGDGVDSDCDGEDLDCDGSGEADEGCGAGCSAAPASPALWLLTALLLGTRRFRRAVVED